MVSYSVFSNCVLAGIGSFQSFNVCVRMRSSENIIFTGILFQIYDLSVLVLCKDNACKYRVSRSYLLSLIDMYSLAKSIHVQAKSIHVQALVCADVRLYELL